MYMPEDDGVLGGQGLYDFQSALNHLFGQTGETTTTHTPPTAGVLGGQGLYDFQSAFKNIPPGGNVMAAPVASSMQDQLARARENMTTWTMQNGQPVSSGPGMALDHIMGSGMPALGSPESAAEYGMNLPASPAQDQLARARANMTTWTMQNGQPVSSGPQPTGVNLQDGFHGMQNNYPVIGPANVGAGYGSPHPLDSIWQSGMPTVPHVWTDADLDPTHVLGVNSNTSFSRGTHGYTEASPMMPLFHADMARQAANQNAALQAMHMMFTGQQNALNQRTEIEKANIMAGRNDHDKLMSVAFNQQLPAAIRAPAIEEGIKKGAFSRETADIANVDTLIRGAIQAGAPGTLKFYAALAQQFDPKVHSRAELNRQLAKAGIDQQSLLEAYGNASYDSSHWFLDRTSPEKATINFLQSLLGGQ